MTKRIPLLIVLAFSSCTTVSREECLSDSSDADCAQYATPINISLKLPNVAQYQVELAYQDGSGAWRPLPANPSLAFGVIHPTFTIAATCYEQQQSQNHFKATLLTMAADEAKFEDIIPCTPLPQNEVITTVPATIVNAPPNTRMAFSGGEFVTDAQGRAQFMFAQTAPHSPLRLNLKPSNAPPRGLIIADFAARSSHEVDWTRSKPYIEVAQPLTDGALSQETAVEPYLNGSDLFFDNTTPAPKAFSYLPQTAIEGGTGLYLINTLGILRSEPVRFSIGYDIATPTALMQTPPTVTENQVLPKVEIGSNFAIDWPTPPDAYDYGVSGFGRKSAGNVTDYETLWLAVTASAAAAQSMHSEFIALGKPPFFSRWIRPEILDYSASVYLKLPASANERNGWLSYSINFKPTKVPHSAH